jgi:hypothetical protein
LLAAAAVAPAATTTTHQSALKTCHICPAKFVNNYLLFFVVFVAILSLFSQQPNG